MQSRYIIRNNTRERRAGDLVCQKEKQREERQNIFLKSRKDRREMIGQGGDEKCDRDVRKEPRLP